MPALVEYLSPYPGMMAVAPPSSPASCCLLDWYSDFDIPGVRWVACLIKCGCVAWSGCPTARIIDERKNGDKNKLLRKKEIAAVPPTSFACLWPSASSSHTPSRRSVGTQTPARKSKESYYIKPPWVPLRAAWRWCKGGKCHHGSFSFAGPPQSGYGVASRPPFVSRRLSCIAVCRGKLNP